MEKNLFKKIYGDRVRIIGGFGIRVSEYNYIFMFLFCRIVILVSLVVKW